MLPEQVYHHTSRGARGFDQEKSITVGALSRTLEAVLEVLDGVIEHLLDRRFLGWLRARTHSL
jgi:hypothetical protein